MDLPDPPVLLITDRRQTDRRITDVVATALCGGCRWVSLREKDLPADAQVALARELLALARPCAARVISHGEPNLARAAGLDGVHLAAAGDPAAARNVLGSAAWISISTHDDDELDRAVAAGADAATVSPVFRSRSKPGYGPALGLERFARAAARSRVPLIALGGIDDAARARACFACGASAVAVMGSIMRAPDPELAMRRLIEAVRKP